MASREILIGKHEAYEEIESFLSVTRTPEEIEKFINDKIGELDRRYESTFGRRLSGEDRSCQKTTEEHSN